MLNSLRAQFSVHRQKLSSESSKAALADDASIAETIFDQGKAGEILPGTDSPNVTLLVKDLGPQVTWRTVFIVEYVSGHGVGLGKYLLMDGYGIARPSDNSPTDIPLPPSVLWAGLPTLASADCCLRSCSRPLLQTRA